jgi:hypothetical protein
MNPAKPQGRQDPPMSGCASTTSTSTSTDTTSTMAAPAVTRYLCRQGAT